ncbi:Peptidase M15A, C-terminal [uncultured Caudovirales phage]|uniref:Peptidase M15A, C-terminal n=1 Tax=uncultured Caudovirales phage TaxID=2100421 RepID=A0A6J7WCT9_9CAUD|nr:Peptidase M15A, C-terminal [uncultured Caudovirales phage]
MTPHFSLAELTTTDHREFDNTPPPEVLPNLMRMALLMEQVRSLLGQPIFVTSGYRSKQVNDAVGSKDTSQHRLGCAVDFKCARLTPDQIVKRIKASDFAFDQLIREFDSWTHISVPSSQGVAPRRQTLIIDRAGARPFV